MLRGALIAFITLSCLEPSYADRPDFKLESDLEQYSSYNTSQSHFSRVRFQAYLKANVYASSASSVEVSYRLWVDPYLWNGGPYPERVRQDERSQLDLRSLFYEYRALPFRIRLGTQQVVWGEALNYFSADLLHPKDFRDFFLNELSWARIPQTGAWAAYDPGDWSMSFVYFPYSETHRLPEAGAEFFLPEYSVESLGLSRPTQAKRFRFDQPSLGAKLGLRPGAFDINFIAVHQRDPQAYYDPQDAELEHSMITSLAVTGSYAWRYWLARAESILMLNRKSNRIQSGQLDTKTNHESLHLLALEWDSSHWLKLSYQAFLNKKYQCEKNFVQDCKSLLNAFGFRLRELGYDIEIESENWIDLQDAGAWVSTRALFPLSTRVSLILRLDQFFGDGSFQALSDRDQLGLRLKARF